MCWSRHNWRPKPPRWWWSSQRMMSYASSNPTKTLLSSLTSPPRRSIPREGNKSQQNHHRPTKPPSEVKFNASSSPTWHPTGSDPIRRKPNPTNPNEIQRNPTKPNKYRTQAHQTPVTYFSSIHEGPPIIPPCTKRPNSELNPLPNFEVKDLI